LVFSEDVASEKDVETLYTEKGAYKYITSALTSFSDTYGTKFGNIKNDFFNKLDINHYLEPNIIYDEETSLKARKQILENISLTTGLIQKGEKIISEGELIDAEKVQILESAEKEFENQTGGNLSWVFFGRILLVLIIFLCLYLYLRNFQAHILRSSKKTIFILFIMTMTVALTSLTARFDFVNIYLIPVIILPILIRTFFDGHIAIFVHILTILLIGFFVGNAFEYGFLNFSAGIIAVFSLTASNSRSKLLLTSLWVVLTYALVYLGFAFIHEGSLENMQYTNFVWFAVNGILLLVSYPLIYLFEKTFGFISDATLLELADTNQPLLRRMAEMAPGTFQHSLQVANLAEEATIKIGGNPLLVRAGALYHDIGKMKSPEFFTENQTPGMNPHDDLSFEESAKIIISHVSVGVEMAKKHNLPNQLIDFIRTHHGTSTVQYFYRSYLKKFPGENVDIKKFKYPGPRPFSKETAVLMMADSVEAASRSLKEMTEKTIGDLVDNIINYQVMEEQFDDANITFKDISTIKKVFKNKLKNIYHARIAYPDAPKKENAKYANTNE
jgi:hypothetical protein